MADALDPATRWRAVTRVFEAALDHPEAARGAFLDAACRDAGGRPDAALRAAVDALLAADAGAEAAGGPTGFLATPPVRLGDVLGDALGERGGLGAGARVGPYRVVRLLGHGGMGEVYLAERADGRFAQRVALKRVRAGAPSASVLRRFEAERDILSRLTHPAVARLLDAGTAGDGHPWIAMDYVDGRPLTEAAAALGVPGRVALLADVAAAVHAAHRALVVHRDLKPSNVLVDAEGGVHLLDFGIARLLDPDADGLTETGQRPMTRAYAAPEQLRGEPVTTATDVYALGVLLYEVLAGRRPFVGDAPALVEAAVLSRDPEPPSRVADPAAAAPRALRGDLDTICLRALCRDPEARYASAEAFEADLRRTLRGQPIAARAPSAAYRLRRFVGRHRGAVATAVGAALVLVGGLVLDGRRVRAERDRAEAARAEAAATAGFLSELFEGADPGLADGDTLSALALLDRGGARLATELRGQPRLQAALFGVVSRAYRTTGAADSAEAFARRALALSRALGDSAGVARARVRLGEALADAGRTGRADAVFALAVDQARAAGDADGLAEALAARALRIGATAAPRRTAVAVIEEAVAMQRARGDRLALGRLLYRLALAQHDAGRFEAIEPLFREALAVQRAAGASDADVARTLFELAQLLTYSGKRADAEPLAREALALRMRVYGPRHARVADVHGLLASIQHVEGRHEAALASARRALELYQAAEGELSDGTLDALQTLALTLTGAGQAEASVAVAQDLFRRQVAVNGEAHFATVGARASLADALQAAGRPAEALPVWLDAAERYRALLGADHPQVATTLASAGGAARQAGQARRAADLYAQALARARASTTEQSAMRARLAFSAGRALAEAGRWPEAVDALTEAAARTDALGATRAADAERRLGAARRAAAQAR